jgi:hypothetical protein
MSKHVIKNRRIKRKNYFFFLNFLNILILNTNEQRIKNNYKNKMNTNS